MSSCFSSILRTLESELQEQYSDKTLEFISEFESEKDFAMYCWKELGISIDYEEYINWEKLFINLPKFGFVGKYLHVRSGTSNSLVCKLVYGFRLV